MKINAVHYKDIYYMKNIFDYEENSSHNDSTLLYSYLSLLKDTCFFKYWPSKTI